MDTIVLYYVILIPCGIVVAAVLGIWLPLARRSDGEARTDARMIFAAGLGVAAAYMAGHAGINGRPAFPPTDVANWLFFIAPAAAVVSLVEALLMRRIHSTEFQPAVSAMRALVAAGALWLVLTPLRASWSPAQLWMWMPALILILVLQWESSAALARRIPSADAALSVFPVVLGTSAALGMSGGAKYGLFAAILVSASGAIFVGSLLKRELPLARGLIAVTTPLAFLLLTLGHFLTELPLSAGALLVAAPFLAWIPQLRALQRLKPWQSALLRVTLIAIVAGIAVAIAYSHFTPPSPDGEMGE